MCAVLRGKDVYCRGCLLAGVQHKMRATLGKHKGTGQVQVTRGELRAEP